ncbi:MAG: cobalamin biosynthesis protein CbiX [bacterium]|nr:cobalamin biosynthesis protein CbiX [Deltaproteobacteria bacterium]MCP4904924.1 cobalamin biosynthesis protein CbiX [bacterium]
MTPATTSSPEDSPARSRRGLVILDHGARDDAANSQLAALADAIARQRPGWLVRHAHMELAEPDLDQAIDSLVRSGVSEIFVHLHFLGSGFHVRESIPELVDTARIRHPGIEIETSDPLGDDPLLADIVLARLDARTGRGENT